jgi:hypothetical protein
MKVTQRPCPCPCNICKAERTKRYLDFVSLMGVQLQPWQHELLEALEKHPRTLIIQAARHAGKTASVEALINARWEKIKNSSFNLEPGALNMVNTDYASLIPPTLEWRKPMCFTSKKELMKQIADQEAVISAKSKRITELEYRLRDAIARADRWKSNTMNLAAEAQNPNKCGSDFRAHAENLRRQLDEANAELKNRDKAFLRNASAHIAGHIAAAGALYNKGDEGKTLGRVVAEQSFGLALELLDVHKGVPAKITLPEKDFTLAEITAIVNGDKVLSDPEREQYNNFLQRKKGKTDEPDQSNDE